MKRILFMHQASTIGGGSYCLLNILKAINRNQIEPIVCLASEGPLKYEIEKIGIKVILFREMSAIPYNRTLFRYKSFKAYYSVFRSLAQFKNLLISYNIDVVYLNNMMIYNYLKVAKECGCKTIIHVREHWPIDQHTTQLGWARKKVYLYADELIAINKFSASIFLEKDATIVYDWIDMESRYEERSLSSILHEDDEMLKVYLYTGGVQRIKGAIEVLSAFTRCIKDNNSRLLIVGIDPNIPFNGLRGRLKSILAKLGIKSYFFRVKDLISKDSRIRCIPSTYMLSHIMQQCYCNLSYFTIPHANLAMAECEIMGTPSIAADNPESREYSLEGELSQLYTPNSFEAFEDAIHKFDSLHSIYKEKLEQRSTEIALLFSKEQNISKLNNVLSRVLRG